MVLCRGWLPYKDTVEYSTQYSTKYGPVLVVEVSPCSEETVRGVGSAEQEWVVKMTKDGANAEELKEY